MKFGAVAKVSKVSSEGNPCLEMQRLVRKDSFRKMEAESEGQFCELLFLWVWSIALAASFVLFARRE